MKKNNKKFENFIFHKIKDLKNPKILEFEFKKDIQLKDF